MINLRQNKGFALIFSPDIPLFNRRHSWLSIFWLLPMVFPRPTASANEKKAYYIADAGLADAYERIMQAGFNTFTSSTCAILYPVDMHRTYIPSSTTDNGVYSVGAVNGNYKVSVVYSGSPRTNYVITSHRHLW